MLDGHGDDIHLIKAKIRYNFSSNVHYQGCSPLLLKELRNKISLIQNYPSPAGRELNIFASEMFKLAKDYFLFLNGATEAIYLIAQKFREQSALIAGPTFSEYEDACRIHQVNYRIVPKCELPEQNLNADVIFICNPNNPDGSLIAFEKLKNLLNSFSKTIFIVDEAYIEFTDSLTSSVSLLDRFSNLVVIRSLTKAFAVPGVRLGYLMAQPDFIQDLLGLKMPWSLNCLAIEAGKFILQNYHALSFDISELLKKTDHFKLKLSAIDWLDIIPGKTTYFLVRLKNRSAADLKQYLIREHGILIRDATNFTGLNGEFIRLSLQAETAIDALINALYRWN